MGWDEDAVVRTARKEKDPNKNYKYEEVVDKDGKVRIKRIRKSKVH